LRLPVHWQDGSSAWTRDISPDGLYLWVPGEHIVTRWCALEIGYEGRLRFRALAEVLRVDTGTRITGLALRLHDRRFEPVR
jgi:hypothetical protein